MPFTYVQSRRSDPGEGWHKRGYRDYGEMWLNIKEGSYGAVRGMGVNENSTFTELLHLVYPHQAVGPWYHVLDVLPAWATGITETVVQALIPPSFIPKGIYAMGDGYPLPEGWAFVLHSRRRALEPSDEPISVLFDGGETLIIKVFDDAGEQRVFDGHQWDYHVPGRPRRGPHEMSVGDYYFYYHGF